LAEQLQAARVVVDRIRRVQELSCSRHGVRDATLVDSVGAFLFLAGGCDSNTSDGRGVWAYDIKSVVLRIPDQDLRRAALGVHCSELCMVLSVSVTIRFESGGAKGC
jgi:hypothetical protein